VLAFFGRFELGRKHPLVDMRVLRERPVLATNVTGLLVGMAMFGSFLLVPQFAQAPESTGYGFGMTVLQAGLIMVPSSVMMLFSGPLAGLLGGRMGFRAVLSLGTLALGVSFAVLTLAHDTTLEFMAANVLVGVGVAFAFASMANLVVGLVHPSEVGIATGVNTIMRTIGGAFGAAVITALLTADTIPESGLPTEHAYTEAFGMALVICVLAFAAARWIPKPKAPRTASQAVAEPA
jgi:MFS family permease